MGDVAPNTCRLPKHLDRGKEILCRLGAKRDGRNEPLYFLSSNLSHLIAPEVRNKMFTKVTSNCDLSGRLVLRKHYCLPTRHEVCKRRSRPSPVTRIVNNREPLFQLSKCKPLCRIVRLGSRALLSAILRIRPFSITSSRQRPIQTGFLLPRRKTLPFWNLRRAKLPPRSPIRSPRVERVAQLGVIESSHLRPRKRPQPEDEGRELHYEHEKGRSFHAWLILTEHRRHLAVAPVAGRRATRELCRVFHHGARGALADLSPLFVKAKLIVLVVRLAARTPFRQ